MLPRPSEFIKCQDIVSCFQSIYNFFFIIFLALAFLMFLIGALEYLLSGAGIYQKGKGKEKMINSIIAIIVVLLIPPILQLINPEIFKGIKLQIPQIKILFPTLKEEYAGEDPNVGYSGPVPQNMIKFDEIKNHPDYNYYTFTNLTARPGVVVRESIVNNLIKLDKCLNKHNLKATITSGYTGGQGPSISRCHTQTGTCIDIIVNGIDCQPWETLRGCLALAGAKFILLEKLPKTPKEQELQAKLKESCKPETGEGCCQPIWPPDNCGIIWTICAGTTGTHIHAVF